MWLKLWTELDQILAVVVGRQNVDVSSVDLVTVLIDSIDDGVVQSVDGAVYATNAVVDNIVRVHGRRYAVTQAVDAANNHIVIANYYD